MTKEQINMLNDLRNTVYEANKIKGFHDYKMDFGTYIALIHSELSEALEAHRKDLWAGLDTFELINPSTEEGFKDIFKDYIKDTVEDEIADAMIRLFDLCGILGINIGRHIDLKLKYNATREIRHGKKY